MFTHIIERLVLGFLLMMSLVAGLGFYLSPQDKLQRVDAVVAISGDDGQRLETAIDLYEQGWTDKLIFSGAARDPKSPSNALIMKRTAVERGVPENDILLDEDSLNTQENARFVIKLAQERDIDSLILVTSPYHQRRAYSYFERVAAGDITILNYSARDEEWRRSQWWATPRGWYLTVSESVKLALSEIQRGVSGSQ
jgi:uncharacterized SAM-binding protein YcdF (DUF218 family)